MKCCIGEFRIVVKEQLQYEQKKYKFLIMCVGVSVYYPLYVTAPWLCTCVSKIHVE